jgi:hypothetical protein
VIEFFGVGAIFVWLYFLDKSDKAEGQAIQHNVDIITQYYQISWVMFGIAVLAEFAMTDSWLSSVFSAFSLAAANVLGVIFGLAMFAVPSYYVYKKVSQHIGYYALKLPEIGLVAGMLMFAIMHTVFLYGVLHATLSLMSGTLAITFGISYCGMALQFRKAPRIRNWSKLVNGMLFLPYLCLVILFVLRLVGFS